jgi:hypothetical protein
MKLKCIKGVANDYMVFCLLGDTVTLVSIDENEIVVEGTSGWCKDHEVTFTAKEFASSFVIINDGE